MNDRSSSALPESAWRDAAERHATRVCGWAERQRDRASRGEKHPVYDFLFDYYNLRPTQLLQWHPGIGVLLEGAGEFLGRRYYRQFESGVGVDPEAFPANRRNSLKWMLEFLKASGERPPQFGCFGLHEWAMVYRSEEVRHQNYPLRLTGDRLAEVVESLPIRCSHYDAFRFFTPEARPLNKLQPTRERQVELDQRGCLHVNMDLFKWAHKLSPWTPSALVADTFLFAVRIREIDMRASPYDLRDLGFEPIRVETSDGRREYERHQRIFAEESRPFRARLIDVCERLLRATASSGTEA